MSILIKGMKMPNACCYCDLLAKEIDRDEQWECPITEKIVHKYVEERKGKPSDCPLVEVPTPHGRLIDADKLEIERRTYETYNDYSETFDMIDNAPTVIESEEQEHDT